jgi:transcription initiation factor TFIIB
LFSGLRASEDKYNQKQTEDIVAVTAVTIREMHLHAVKFFPEDFSFAVPINQLPQK